LHPGRQAAIELDGVQLGHVGQLHPRLQQRYDLPKAPIVFDVDLAPMLLRPMPRHVEISKFQPVLRDISISVDESVPAQALSDAVYARSSSDSRLSALREFRLFDVYRAPPNSSKVAEASANALLNKEKSLAFRIVLQDTERPVSDADADAAVDVVLQLLKQQFEARLRQ
ncbi:MAG: phenylalanine--tRNA ligase subunit beta, partial [Burkholderiaceae bacterium]|nr:phenylalanine--tRNA ligase subunit beta [Burkholderiaceae bacterium]